MEKFNYQPEKVNIIESTEKKETIWSHKLEELSSVADRLETSIDEKIVETVAALQLNGFSTSASCEGHTDIGCPAPWVDVMAPNEPKEKFIGQKEIFQKIADEYNVSIEEAEHNQEIFDKAMEDCSKNGETEEYKQWQEENDKLLLKMTDLLNDFYKERKVSSDERLKLKLIHDMSFRIHNGGDDYERSKKEWIDGIKSKNDSGLNDRLVTYQEEMINFTAFLKQRFFSN